MARIRSVHPDFFSDEDIVEVSVEARLLLIGLGVQADDKGIFPWKVKTLKMRIFPADDCDVADLLSELEREGLVRRYEMDGRQWGAVKKFRKHQRPKSPNDIHPAPPEILNYVGLPPSVSETPPPKETPIGEIDPDEAAPFPPNGEKAIQMEDGEEDGGEKNPPKPPWGPAFDEFWLACPNKVSKDTAQRAWSKLSVGEQAEALHSVSAFYEWFKAKHPTATPLHPSKFLSRKRWQDEGWQPPPSQQIKDRAAHYAQKINSGERVNPFVVSVTLANEIVGRGLSTADQVRKAGVSI